MRRHAADPGDPRSWPDDLVVIRDLAMAYALGWRTDPEATAMFLTWLARRPATPRMVSAAADRYTTGGVGG